MACKAMGKGILLFCSIFDSFTDYIKLRFVFHSVYSYPCLEAFLEQHEVCCNMTRMNIRIYTIFALFYSMHVSFCTNWYYIYSCSCQWMKTLKRSGLTSTLGVKASLFTSLCLIKMPRCFFADLTIQLLYSP